MIREIEEAVIEYKENTAVELYNLMQNDTEMGYFYQLESSL